MELIQEEKWDQVIEPRSYALSIDFKELWKNRDLLIMFVKRDVVTVYKQTILGPIWYIVQPILTTAIFMLVFGQIAQISTDGLPQILFYLSGIILWNYFSECFTSTSKTFNENQDLFGKVYFPRLLMPISKVVSGLIKFCIQFLFFLGIYLFYLLSDYKIQPTNALLYFPIFVLIMAGLGLGSGIIFTALTAKYRDLNFLITFGVQLLMYATPVIYPVSAIPEKYKVIIIANPITAVVEGFRSAFLGSGTFDPGYLLYSIGFTSAVLILGIIIFNRTEKTFMDTV